MSSGKQTLESMNQAVWYNQWTLNKFKKYLKGDILEVGCGIGNFTSSLLKYGTVWAIDIENGYIEETRKLTDGKTIVGFGDIEKGEYFFNDREFDTIVCLNVLEHIEDDKISLKNMFKLLKKGGRLVLLVPSHPFLYGKIDESIGHYRRYNKRKLKIMINDAGFEIIEARIINMLGAVGWWFTSRLFSNSKVESRKIQLFNLTAPIALPLEDIAEPPFGTSILTVSQKPR